MRCATRDASRIAAVQEMTQDGAESVLECVGNQSAMATAIGIAGIGSKKQRLIELQLLCRELFSLNDQNFSVAKTKLYAMRYDKKSYNKHSYA